MNKTAIEWTDYTWNPITGCENGCSYCYARNIVETRFKGSQAFPDGFKPTFHLDRIDEPLSKKIKPGSKIFTVSMGELFITGHEDWTERVINTINQRRDVTFQLLTKQPQNLTQWSPFPENCWVGVSATDYSMTVWANYYLKNIKAKVKFISFEPLLDWMGFPTLDCVFKSAGINWLIIGCETRNGKPVQGHLPKIEWIKEIVDAADQSGIPVFLKDNLETLIPEGSCDKDWAFANGGTILLRQEFPREVQHG